MNNQNWLTLSEYSSKYRVSMSTLRRRIKTENIQFVFQEGKYLVVDQPESSQPAHRPSPKSEAPMTTLLDSQNKVLKEAKKEYVVEEPMITTANKLLLELKKAYSQILQEKEELIIQLKDEVSDLRTLVRVLESENERLKGPKKYFGN